VEESYLYNGDGTSTITKYIDPPLRERNFGVFAESMLHICVDAVCVMTMRDSSSRPVRKVFYDVDNRIIQRVLLRYDSAGRLIEEGEIESRDRVRSDFRNVYRYTDSDLPVEIEMYWANWGAVRKRLTYTEQGDLQQEERLQIAEGVFLPSQGPWANQYAYLYDERGNWIAKTHQIRKLDTNEITHTDETKRTLTYY
jgi:hypothetical protein